MKTDDLISLLAANIAAVPRGAASRQIAAAMAVGIALAIVVMLPTIGARPDLAQAISMPMFWMKVRCPAAVACAGFVTLARLARREVGARRPGGHRRADPVAVAAAWLMAIEAYAGAGIAIAAGIGAALGLRLPRR